MKMTQRIIIVIMRENSKGITNHFVTKHKDFVIETIKQVDGGNHRDLPAGGVDQKILTKPGQGIEE